MTKFVLDTSVIVTDPKCLQSFPNAEIIIQIGVLTELDKIKKYPSEVGKNARLFIRTLDKLCERGDLCTGIQLSENNSKLVINSEKTNSDLGDPTYVDNRILSCAISLKSKAPDDEIVVVSRDINLRIRARACGLAAQDYDHKKTLTNEFYSGVKRIQNEKLGKELNESQDKYVVCDDYLNKELLPNECVCFTGEDGRVISIGRKYKNEIHYVNGTKPWGLSTRSAEQAFSVDMLMDTRVPLVSLVGTAGTGKTLLSVACALESVINAKNYSRFIVYRPIQPVGTEIGYLPGDMEEKLDPWMAAIKDSFDFLTSNAKGRRSNWRDKFSQYSERIDLEALTYIRGRSISNAFILMDEAQNISREEAKAILTRVGHGTKIVLTGDVEQIDNRNLDAENNGLSYVIEKFKHSELAGHITLTKGERSPLATLSAKVL